jgi:bacterioferritin (cytochrome b1)
MIHPTDKDPTTRRMLESILAVEEQHADELADLLQDVSSGLKAKPRAFFVPLLIGILASFVRS